MSARDEMSKELSAIIKREYTRAIDRKRMRDCYDAPADAILAAGYSKPRTITSQKDLDALPVGSVIWAFDFQAGDSNSWQLFDDVNDLTDEDGDLAKTAWLSSAYKDEHSSNRVLLRTNGHPIAVLYSPEES